eukprot:8379493-Lingulodinium_polyedra.AAC.1
MRAPKTGVRAECVRVLFASRCGGGRSIRPYHCVAFVKHCAIMRSNRPCTAAAARNSHACAFHVRASSWSVHGVRGRAICQPL